MLRRPLAASMIVLAMIGAVSSPVEAQTVQGGLVQSGLVQIAQAESPAPGRLERFRERTRETWTQMKQRWSLQREKYSLCRKEARRQRLAGRKTRKFLEGCMSS